MDKILYDLRNKIIFFAIKYAKKLKKALFLSLYVNFFKEKRFKNVILRLYKAGKTTILIH